MAFYTAWLLIYCNICYIPLVRNLIKIWEIALFLKRREKNVIICDVVSLYFLKLFIKFRYNRVIGLPKVCISMRLSQAPSRCYFAVSKALCNPFMRDDFFLINIL
jgi:hypothetical protein